MQVVPEAGCSVLLRKQCSWRGFLCACRLGRNADTATSPLAPRLSRGLAGRSAFLERGHSDKNALEGRPASPPHRAGLFLRRVSDGNFTVALAFARPDDGTITRHLNTFRRTKPSLVETKPRLQRWS